MSLNARPLDRQPLQRRILALFSALILFTLLALSGVRAAHAAGMMTIMVPDLLEATEEMRGLCVAVTETLHGVRDLIAGKTGPDPL